MFEAVSPPQEGAKSTPGLRLIGVDPGLDGGVAIRDADRLEVFDMPTLTARGKGAKGKRDVDPIGIARLFEYAATPRLIDGTRLLAVVEQVGAAPKDGAVSAFTFGAGFGVVLGALAILRVPIVRPRPSVWKARLRVPAAKDGAVARADAFFPAYASAWRGPRGGLKDGRAEAALLTEYGLREDRGDFL